MAQLFEKIAIAGIGLIGGSLALRAKRDGLAAHVVAFDHDPDHCAEALKLGLVDEASSDPAIVAGAELLIVSVPVGACGEVMRLLAPYLVSGAIVSDTGSVKMAVVRDMTPAIPEGVHFVPGHPLAGTEYSGPGAAFPTLFDGRWTLLTPLPDAHRPPKYSLAVDRVAALWRAAGSNVELMDPQHHDKILAITSHLPHLIAYTIVGTATDLESALQQEVVKFSATGFRDFTRIASSDPVMWRDVFLNNREAVLEVAQRFTEDLTYLQRAIRWGEGDKLLELFTRTRAVRRSIIDAKQA